MYKIQRNRPQRRSNMDAKPKPGVYNSEVVGVEQSPYHNEGDAIVVHYDLTDSSGVRYSHQETFRIKGEASEREREFDNYLSELGFDSYDDFVGTKELLTLAEVKKRAAPI